jgi:hypothetical protein
MHRICRFGAKCVCFSCEQPCAEFEDRYKGCESERLALLQCGYHFGGSYEETCNGDGIDRSQACSTATDKLGQCSGTTVSHLDLGTGCG